MYRKVEGDLEDIDNSMERLKDKYPEFYNEYMSARIIKETGGGGHKKPPSPPTDPKK